MLLINIFSYTVYLQLYFNFTELMYNLLEENFRVNHRMDWIAFQGTANQYIYHIPSYHNQNEQNTKK